MNGALPPVVESGTRATHTYTATGGTVLVQPPQGKSVEAAQKVGAENNSAASSGSGDRDGHKSASEGATIGDASTQSPAQTRTQTRTQDPKSWNGGIDPYGSVVGTNLDADAQSGSVRREANGDEAAGGGGGGPGYVEWGWDARGVFQRQAFTLEVWILPGYEQVCTLVCVCVSVCVHACVRAWQCSVCF